MKVLHASCCATVLLFSLLLFMGCGGEMHIPANGSNTDHADDPGPSSGDGGDDGTIPPSDGDAGTGDTIPPNSDDDDCTDDMVAVCHIPNNNPDAAHVICVSQAATDTLLEHGDTLGACPE